MKIFPKVITGTIGVAAALALSVSTTQAQNLLVDPGFESGMFEQPNPIPIPGGVNGGWASFGGSITTAAAHSGICSALIADNGWNPQGVYQTVSASPGETLDLNAWYMSPNPSVAGYATPALVQISFFDINDNGLGVFGNWQPLGAAGTWVKSPDVIATAPAGTAYVGVYLMMMDNNINGLKFYYDDASLTQVVPEPASLALLAFGVFGITLLRRHQD
jgi:hypothetical protein